MTRMTITHTLTYVVDVEDYIAAGIDEDAIETDEFTLPDDFDAIANYIPTTEYEDELVPRWARHCIKIPDQVITWTTDQKGS
jgi:hypothetical protein